MGHGRGLSTSGCSGTGWPALCIPTGYPGSQQLPLSAGIADDNPCNFLQDVPQTDLMRGAQLPIPDFSVISQQQLPDPLSSGYQMPSYQELSGLVQFLPIMVPVLAAGSASQSSCNADATLYDAYDGVTQDSPPPMVSRPPSLPASVITSQPVAPQVPVMPTVQAPTDPATPEVVAPPAAAPVAPPAPVPAPFPEAPQAPSVPPAMIKKLSTRKVSLGSPPLPSTSGLFVDQEDRLDQLACVRDRRRTNRRPSGSWSGSTLLGLSPDYRRPAIRGRALRTEEKFISQEEVSRERSSDQKEQPYTQEAQVNVL